MDHHLIIDWVIILMLGTALVAMCHRFHLSPILGYLATGVIVGPEGMGVLNDGPIIRLLAEFGVVFLMFTIGLEFSFAKLKAAKHLVFGLGGYQVLVTAAVLGLIGAWLGLSRVEAFIVGIALAMSSTAIVLKQLGEQYDLGSPHGRIATAILLFQDIVAVPVLVVLPVLAGDPTQIGTMLGLASVKASLVLVSVLVFGFYILPPILKWVASTRSLELFMLTTLLIAISAAGVSVLAGLSPTLGAFIAGMLLSETLFRHQIESDIRPFRDLMLGLFFVSIGIQLNITSVLAAPSVVLLVLASLVVLKPILLAPMSKRMGFSANDAARSAINLAQGGEFGLLVLAAAMGYGLISGVLAQPVLAGIMISMVIAPVLLRYSQQISNLFKSNKADKDEPNIIANIVESSHDYSAHVIVCGYGRLGQNVVGILQDFGIPALALDLDLERVHQAVAIQEAVMFGNATSLGVLNAAGLGKAKAIVIAIDSSAIATQIIKQVRAVDPQIPILVRSRSGCDDSNFTSLGADVFAEGLEVSLAFAGQLLGVLGIPHSQVEAKLNAIRAEDYSQIRTFFHSSENKKAKQQEMDYGERFHAFVISDGDGAIGKTIRELQLDDNVTLIEVRRGAIKVPAKSLDNRLQSGDVLVFKGNSEALGKTSILLQSGQQ